MSRGEKNGIVRGEITLFLSLILMVLVSFLCTALQSARAAGSRYLFTLASEAVTKSMFAVYDTRVWEDYRIMMLSDTEKAQQIARECGDSYTENATLFPVTITSIQLTDRETLAQNGAAGWEEAAVSYMETRLPVEMIEWLWEQSGLAEGFEDMTKWMTGFKDLLKPMVELEKKLCDLEAKLSEAAEAFQEGKELLTAFQNSVESFRQVKENGASQEELRSAWDALQTCFTHVKEHTGDRRNRLASLAEKAVEHLETVRQLKNQIQELMDSLGGGQTSGLAALADLGGYLGGLTERFDFLQDLPQQLQSQESYLGQLAGMTLPSLEEILTGDGQRILDALQETAAGVSGEEWEPSHLDMTTGTEEDAANLNRIMNLRETLEQGILGLVVRDSAKLSQASLNRVLPRTERENRERFLDEAYHSLLYGEYALRHTAEYGQDGAAGLQYETEYLIAGEQTDQANLAEVAARLFVLRGAANLSYLLTSEASRAQAHSLGAGVSAVLGGWIPASLIAVIVLVLWSLAEAVCDVRGLLEEGRVPFLKKADSWQLSWSRLWSLFDSGFETAKRENGMAYEDYLRLLLFLTPLEDKCFRTMEVAEENIGVGRGTFRIDETLCRGKVVVSGQALGRDHTVSLTYGY